MKPILDTGFVIRPVKHMIQSYIWARRKFGFNGRCVFKFEISFRSALWVSSLPGFSSSVSSSSKRICGLGPRRIWQKKNI